MDETIQEEFANHRYTILSKLYENSRNFAATLYSKVATGPFWKRRSETFSPYLPINYESLCCLIEQDTERTMKGKPTFCLISKTKQIEKGKEGKIYLVTLPREYPLNNFILKTLPSSPQIIYLNDAPTSVRNIKQMIQRKEINTCFYPNLLDLDFIGLDTFTNEYITGFFLRSLYEEYAQTGLDGVIKYHMATICHNKQSENTGTILMDYMSLGNLNDYIKTTARAENIEYIDVSGEKIVVRSLLPSVIIEILKQIVINLDFLHQYAEFNHGDLKATNILVDDKETKGTYDDLSWDSPFTLKFTDFSKSSFTLNLEPKLIRIFNRSVAADSYLTISPFKPVVGTFFDEPYYVLDNSLNVTSLALIRHMGVPFYFSFDTYTALISLMLLPEIYYPIMSNETLRKVLWDNLWVPDDYTEVWNRLYNAMSAQKPISYNIIMEILKGIKLKCQGNKILMEGLRSL